MGFPAARMTDMIVSPATLGVPTPIVAVCAPTVLIMGLPAARVTDTCGVDAIVMGSLTVITFSMPQARLLDPTASGGMVTAIGAVTVLVG